MPSIEQTMLQPASVLATNTGGAGAAATATKVVGSGSYALITAITISASAAPAAAVKAELRADGASIADINIPASAYAPIHINFAQSPLQLARGEDVALFVPAHGGAVIVTATIYGRIAS